MPLRLAPVRAAFLALVVLLVTAGFLGMHVLTAHGAGMASGAHGAGMALGAHGAGMGSAGMASGAHGAGMGSAGMASGAHGAGMGAAATAERTTAGLAHAHGVASTTGAECDGECPPSGVAHTTDCTPAPGVPAPVPPAVVVLARSDAAPASPPDARPGAVALTSAPRLEALSISRT